MFSAQTQALKKKRQKNLRKDRRTPRARWLASLVEPMPVRDCLKM